MTKLDALFASIAAAAIYATVLFCIVAVRQIDHNMTVAASQEIGGRQ